MEEIVLNFDANTFDARLSNLLQSLETQQQFLEIIVPILSYLFVTGMVGFMLGAGKEMFLEMYADDTEAAPAIQVLVAILEMDLEIHISTLLFAASVALFLFQQPELAAIATVATLIGVFTAVSAHATRKYLDKAKHEPK